MSLLDIGALRRAGGLPDAPQPDGRRIWADVEIDGSKYPFRVELLARSQPFGGFRWFLRCTSCQLPRTKLYNLGERYQCRVCLNLTYRSRRLSRVDRWRLQSDRLMARAGCTRQDDYHYKPKGMRWATFNDLMDRAETYDTAALLTSMGPFFQLSGGRRVPYSEIRAAVKWARRGGPEKATMHAHPVG